MSVLNTNWPPATAELRDWIADTKFAIEATRYEQHQLWNEFANRAKQYAHRPTTFDNNRVEWQEINSGYGWEVGKIERKPVMLSLMWAIIQGQRVLFWHATSQAVDYVLIEEWMKLRIPQLYPENGRQRTTDPENFYNMIHVFNEEAKKVS